MDYYSATSNTEFLSAVTRLLHFYRSHDVIQKVARLISSSIIFVALD